MLLCENEKIDAKTSNKAEAKRGITPCFKLLTPTDEFDLSVYGEALNYVFANEIIHNVAVSGPYGSGKSSLLKAYNPSLLFCLVSQTPRYMRMYRTTLVQAYVADHPLCEKCAKAGRYVPVEEVHHIVPLRDGGSNDPSNLMSLCRRCHAEIHGEMRTRSHNQTVYSYESIPLGAYLEGRSQKVVKTT